MIYVATEYWYVSDIAAVSETICTCKTYTQLHMYIHSTASVLSVYKM